MRALADALQTSEGTRARTAKVEALGNALRDVALHEPARLPFAARLLTGVLLPTGDDRTLGTKKKGGRRSGRRPDIRQASKQLKLFEDD